MAAVPSAERWQRWQWQLCHPLKDGKMAVTAGGGGGSRPAADPWARVRRAWGVALALRVRGGMGKGQWTYYGLLGQPAKHHTTPPVRCLALVTSAASA